MSFRNILSGLILVASPLLVSSGASATVVFDSSQTVAYTVYDNTFTGFDIHLGSPIGTPSTASDPTRAFGQANTGSNPFTLTTLGNVSSDTNLTQARAQAEIFFHVTSAGTLRWTDQTTFTGNTTSNNEDTTLFEDGNAVVSLSNGAGGTVLGSYAVTVGHLYGLRRDTGINGIGGLAGTLSGTTTITSAPEPSTWAMLLLGFAGLGFTGYRQAKRKAA